AWMSDRAWPLAPKLACRTVSLGAAVAWARKTNGAARPAAASRFRAARRGVGGVVLMGLLLAAGVPCPQAPCLVGSGGGPGGGGGGGRRGRPSGPCPGGACCP